MTPLRRYATGVFSFAAFILLNIYTWEQQPCRCTPSWCIAHT